MDTPEIDLSRIVEDLRSLAVPVDSISPDPANAKDHPEAQIEDLAASLRRFGQVKPIVVRRDSRVILAGNGTYTALKKLGRSHVAAIFVEFNSLDGTAFAIADNRIAEGGTWNKETLARLIPQLQLQDERLDNMLARLNADQQSVAQLANKPSKSRKIPQAIVKSEIVWDSDQQQQAWFSFLRKLRERYAAHETHGARIAQFIRDQQLGP